VTIAIDKRMQCLRVVDAFVGKKVEPFGQAETLSVI
jgi:hypothetical protein